MALPSHKALGGRRAWLLLRLRVRGRGGRVVLLRLLRRGLVLRLLRRGRRLVRLLRRRDLVRLRGGRRLVGLRRRCCLVGLLRRRRRLVSWLRWRRLVGLLCGRLRRCKTATGRASAPGGALHVKQRSQHARRCMPHLAARRPAAAPAHSTAAAALGLRAQAARTVSAHGQRCICPSPDLSWRIK